MNSLFMQDELPIYLVNKATLHILLHIKPNATKNQIIGTYGDRLKIAIAAVPYHDKANKTLKNYMAELLNITKNDVIIIKGLTSHLKTISVPIDAKNAIDQIIDNFVCRS